MKYVLTRLVPCSAAAAVSCRRRCLSQHSEECMRRSVKRSVLLRACSHHHPATCVCNSAHIAILLTVPTGIHLVMAWCEHGLFILSILRSTNMPTPKSTLLVFHIIVGSSIGCRNSSQHGYVRYARCFAATEEEAEGR